MKRRVYSPVEVWDVVDRVEASKEEGGRPVRHIVALELRDRDVQTVGIAPRENSGSPLTRAWRPMLSIQGGYGDGRWLNVVIRHVVFLLRFGIATT